MSNEPNENREQPHVRPGEFCREHWSWLCQQRPVIRVEDVERAHPSGLVGNWAGNDALIDREASSDH